MKENRNERQDNFLREVTDTLDASLDQIDDATRTRLCVARRETLAVLDQRRSPAWWVTAGGLAAGVLVAVLSVALWETDTAHELPLAGLSQKTVLEDMALLGDSEELAFFEELEFYIWLDDEAHIG
jgi:hypothetical protein